MTNAHLAKVSNIRTNTKQASAKVIKSVNKKASPNGEAFCLVPGAGVEPARACGPQDFKSGVSTNSTIPAIHYCLSSYLRKKHRTRCLFRGAKDGVRTRDLDLGKVALYQLSYFRKTTSPPVRRIVDANLGHFPRLSSVGLKKNRELFEIDRSKTDSE